ncbi:citronellyl-CoA dehydrogenase [Streptomyces litmocidini]|uniref:acyl-CoA dehydrogenase family protein n=1 Tax=Streptomyces litmocidini TaxID=67318 RepID=UPI00167CE436|nr:acyl-CoA dehydrogenase [Streptomyces litmocidini]GGU80610.1 citronellyl-CoA dehydrogenase [Streptomyces litmocidini]
MPTERTLAVARPPDTDGSHGTVPRLAQALESLPVAASRADGRTLIRALGEAGVVADCLAGSDPRQPLRLPLLRTVLGGLTGRVPHGAQLACLLHLSTVTPLVLRLAGGERADPLVRGRATAALAATDSGAAGSDLPGLTTAVRRHGEDLVIDGHKTWITGARWADHFLVLARHRPGRHFSDFCLVMVPADARGVSVEPIGTPVMAGAGLGSLALDGVRLPAEAMLGRPGRGMVAFTEQMGAERLAGGMWTASLCRRLLATAAAGATRRHLAGRALWTESAVRQRLAALLARVRLLEALVDDVTARTTATGRFPLADTAVVKATVGPLAAEVADACLHLAGAAGLTDDGDLLRTAQDVRTFAVAGGSTETMLELVAEELPAAGRAEPRP